MRCIAGRCQFLSLFFYASMGPKDIPGGLYHKMTANRRPTASIDNHGYKLNEADSPELARRFTEAGYRLADDAGRASEKWPGPWQGRRCRSQACYMAGFALTPIPSRSWRIMTAASV